MDHWYIEIIGGGCMENKKQIFILKDADGKDQKFTADDKGNLVPLIEVKEERPVKAVYSPDEARKVLGMSRNPFMKLLHSGQLRGVKAGRRWLISSQALDNFLNPAK